MIKTSGVVNIPLSDYRRLKKEENKKDSELDVVSPAAVSLASVIAARNKKIKPLRIVGGVVAPFALANTLYTARKKSKAKKYMSMSEQEKFVEDMNSAKKENPSQTFSIAAGLSIADTLGIYKRKILEKDDNNIAPEPF